MGAILSRNKGDDLEDGALIDYGLSPEDLQQLEEQLLKVEAEPIFKKLGSKEKVNKIITAEHINTPFLKEIFKGNSEEALDLLNQSRLTKCWELGYEHDLLLAYWLAIQKEDITVASSLVDFDTSLRYITTLAMKGKDECPITDVKMDRSQFKLKPKSEATPTPNNVSGQPTPRSPELKVLVQNSALLSVDDKSGASIADKSQHEGGSKNKSQATQPKVNDIGLTVTDLFEGGNSDEDASHCSHSDSDDESHMSSHSSADNDAWNNREESKEDEGSKSSDDGSEQDDQLSNAKNEQAQTMKSNKEMPPPFVLFNHNMEDYLEKKGITGKDIELTQIRTKWQIKKIKVGFQLNFPDMMAQIIRILLFREEVHLACYLTAFYNFTLKQPMLVKAITKDHYKWINYVWAFHKNYYNFNKDHYNPDIDKMIWVDGKEKINVDLKELFRLVIGAFTNESFDKALSEVEKCCEWYLDFSDQNEKKAKTSEEGSEDEAKPSQSEDEEQEEEDEGENILKALLNHLMDNLALKYMGYYSDYLTANLFLFSLETNNKQFIQQSLIMGAFDKQIFSKEKVVLKMIEFLEVGSKTNFLLNTILLVDVTIWKNKSIIMLIDTLQLYTDDTYDKNRLLLSYNPMQAIALSAEILDSIARSRKRFENQCNNLKDDLLELGKVYNSKIDDEESFEALLMDTDFENRTVLKIITASQFAQLMHEDDPKAENIMGQIYVGKESTQCDGNIYGYSTFMHILSQKPKKIPEGDKDAANFMKMITIDFEYKTQVDYTFQHRYRSKSINMYFIKEMIFGLITTGISIMIYFNYLKSFVGPKQYISTQKFDNGTIKSSINDTFLTNEGYDYAMYVANIHTQHQYLSKELYHEAIEENYTKFIGTWSYVQYGMTAILLLTLALRLYFNLFKNDKVNAIVIDSYLKMDMLFAIYSILVFWYIQIQDASVLYGPQKKKIDWAVALVFILALLRYFQLQLVVSSVSKMLLTLIYMVIDVLPFAVIMLAYMYVATQIFSTRYQDINQDQYGNIFQSLMTTFDAMMGGYAYSGVKEDEWVYTLMIIFHIFVINILMLNFMIAILSTTYGDMLESGSFLYKCALYNYCERYMIAFLEDRLGELVVHSPPMNIFTLVMLPFTLIPDRIDEDGNRYSFMAQVANYFSIFIFWLENVLGIIFFMFFEISLMIFVYLITLFNIIYSTPGLFTTAFNCIKWILFGIFYLIYLLLKDTYMLMWIMSCHQGCIEADPSNGQANENDDDGHVKNDFNRQISVYNDLRNVVIDMYLKEHQDQKGEIENEKEVDKATKAKELDNLRTNILDKLNEDQEDMGDDYRIESFNVKLVAIQDEWKKSKVPGPDEQDETKEQPEEEQQEAELNDLSMDETGSKPKQKEAASKIGPMNPKQKLQQQLIGAQRQGTTDDHVKATEIKDALILKESDENNQDDDDDDGKEEKLEYPKDECDLVEEILTKFMIGSDSVFLDTVNLVLMLRALPNKIVAFNLKTSMLFNFANLQNSLIAFQTSDQVDAFEHFDTINRKRIQDIRDCIISQNNDLDQVNTIMSTIEDYVQNYDKIIKDFAALWKGWTRIRENKDEEFERKKNKVYQPVEKKKGNKGGPKNKKTKGK